MFYSLRALSSVIAVFCCSIRARKKRDISLMKRHHGTANWRHCTYKSRCRSPSRRNTYYYHRIVTRTCCCARWLPSKCCAPSCSPKSSNRPGTSIIQDITREFINLLTSYYIIILHQVFETVTRSLSSGWVAIPWTNTCPKISRENATEVV